MSDERVDEQAGKHPEGSSNHSLPAAHIFDDPQADDSCRNVHSTENDGSDVYYTLACN